MITCPECCADNMIGSIFCRSCHAKLNLDELSPDAFDEEGDTAAKRAMEIVKKVLGLGAILALIGVLLLIFLSTPQETGILDEKTKKGLNTKFRRIQAAKARPSKVSVSSQEATAALNQILKLPREEGGKKLPKHLSAEFTGSGTVRAVLRSAILGKIKLYTTVEGRITGGDSGLNWVTTNAKLGKLPMIAGLKNVCAGQLGSLLNSHETISKLKSNITDVSIEGGKAVITVQKKKKGK